MTKTKKDFTKAFVLALAKISVQIGQDLFDSFRRESLNYKYLRLSGHDPRQLDLGFNNLKHRGIIKSNGSDGYAFTAKGKVWYRKSLLKYNGLRQLPWDKKWRIVIFDIPNDFSQARHVFRSKLKLLGFQMLQKSVFVVPYPCKREVGDLCNRLKISAYVCLIVAESLGSFEDLMAKTFDL